MAGQKYFDLKKIFGEEMEALLLVLKDLIISRKITDNLPNNVKIELSNLNHDLDEIEIKIDDYHFEIIDGGEYNSK